MLRVNAAYGFYRYPPASTTATVEWPIGEHVATDAGIQPYMGDSGMRIAVSGEQSLHKRVP